jgi:gamma-resorcylate decarboxylase
MIIWLKHRQKSEASEGIRCIGTSGPTGAAQELTRCIKELIFCGALVNEFTQFAEADTIDFYDMPQYRDFWATVQALDVPFYLHPRSPLPAHQPASQGHPWLTGSVGLHRRNIDSCAALDGWRVVRRVSSRLKLIIGHLGEGLPCNIWRIDNRISRTLGVRPKAKHPIGNYLRENFYITTSGKFRTQTLTEVMLEIGADRILYSVDFPFEDMGIAAEWFDRAPLSEADRLKIGCCHAQHLFHLSTGPLFGKLAHPRPGAELSATGKLGWRIDRFRIALDPLETGGDCSDWRLHCEHGAEPSFAVRNALVSFRSFGQWIGLND